MEADFLKFLNKTKPLGLTKDWFPTTTLWMLDEIMRHDDATVQESVG